MKLDTNNGMEDQIREKSLKQWKGVEYVIMEPN